MSTKKRRGPAPTGKGTPVGVRFQPPHLAALDAWIAKHPRPKPSRPEAIRQIVGEFLTGQGHMRTRPDLRKPKDHPAEPPRGNVQVASAEALKRKRS